MSVKARNGRQLPKEGVERQLEEIKRLLILFLQKAGASQGEIAKAIQMDLGNFSRMMPGRKIVPFEWGTMRIDKGGKGRLYETKK